MDFTKYVGRVLDTDEYAKARNERSKLVNELENLEFKTGSDHLLLKWGTLKGWDFTNNPKGMELLKEYESVGSSMSAMAQKDTERQKEIICELIDVCTGSIQNDWDGEHYTKEQAKEYVRNYSS